MFYAVAAAVGEWPGAFDEPGRSAGAPAPADDDPRFAPDGHWRTPPAIWNGCDAAPDESEFLEVLRGCLASLPADAALAYRLRESKSLPLDQIGVRLGITPEACAWLLYQARMRLRELLDERWFARRRPGQGSANL